MEENRLRRAYKITVITGLAMMASLLIYAIVVETIRKQYASFGGFNPVSGDVFAILRYVFLTVAVIEFFVIRILNRLILSGKIPARVSAGAGAYPPGVQKLMSASIVTFALCESVAIYGLVLFLIQGSTTDFYLFLILSLFCFSMFFPKYATWEESIRDGERTAGRKRGA